MRMPKSQREIRYWRRKMRSKKKIFGTEERPRFSVYKSTKHIYAQIIDDSNGQTLVASSSLDPGVRDARPEGGKTAVAAMVGAAIAEKALEKGIKKLAFDKGGFAYHGRVKALADGAREKGLVF